MDELSQTFSKLDIAMPGTSNAPAKPGGYKEKMLTLPEGPGELSKDATQMCLPWEVPYKPPDRKKVLVNGGTDTLTVEDLTDFEHPSRLEAFVKAQCPNLKRLTLHFQISRWDSGEEIAEEIKCILGFCLLLPDDCKFSIQAEYVTCDVEEWGPKTLDEEMGDANARREVMKYFLEFAKQKGRMIEFEDP
jgi:hypothetical protein